jgi:hypothetical protein
MADVAGDAGTRLVCAGDDPPAASIVTAATPKPAAATKTARSNARRRAGAADRMIGGQGTGRLGGSVTG